LSSRTNTVYIPRSSVLLPPQPAGTVRSVPATSFKTMLFALGVVNVFVTRVPGSQQHRRMPNEVPTGPSRGVTEELVTRPAPPQPRLMKSNSTYWKSSGWAARRVTVAASSVRL